MELAGSFGDLGTLLPIAAAMVLINGLDPVGMFFSIGLYYILAGLFFGVTVPIQPMKVIGAYAVATALTPQQILSSGLIIGVFLLVIGLTGAIDAIRRLVHISVIRGVQLSTGALLASSGVKMMIGTSTYQTLQQAAEPYLAFQAVAGIPVGILIGLGFGVLTLFLLDSKRVPAGLAVIIGGLAFGLIFGTRSELAAFRPGLTWPDLLPFTLPAMPDFSFALIVLVLPQIPMTLGNAVFAYTDLSRQYFGDASARVTNRSACLSMAAANFLSFLLGGMPLCHGAGGLAAHYRFGARTAGSNIFIGAIFIGLTLVLGPHVVSFLHLLPMAILGLLLLFAGLQLAMTVMDLTEKKDGFVAMLILGITLASNLAAGFLAGIVVAIILRWKKLSV
jgi:SulP family sulfate permease